MPGTRKLHDTIMRAAFGKVAFPSITQMYVALTTNQPPDDGDPAKLIALEPEIRSPETGGAEFTRLTNGTAPAPGEFSTNQSAGAATQMLLHVRDAQGGDYSSQLANIQPGDVIYVTADPQGPDTEFYVVSGSTYNAGQLYYALDIGTSGMLSGMTIVPAGPTRATIAQRYFYQRIPTAVPDWGDVAANGIDPDIREVVNTSPIQFPVASGPGGSGRWGQTPITHFALVVDPVGNMAGAVAGEVWWYGLLTDSAGEPAPVTIQDGDQLTLPAGGLVCDFGPRPLAE